MLAQLHRQLGILKATGRLGSRRWASALWGRYPLAEFAAEREPDWLRFVELGVSLPSSAVAIVLPQYKYAVALARAGMVLSYEEEHLFAAIGGLRLEIQTSEELLILHELFLESDYGWAFNGPTTVVDVGMNVGFTALCFATNDSVKVVGFEPFKPTFEQATQNLRLNPHLQERVSAFNYGLGLRNEDVRWEYDPQHRGSCGTFGCAIAGETNDRTSERVELRRATEALSAIIEANEGRQLIAKIDCEGAEYDILNDLAGSGCLQKFNGMMIEWHERGGRDPVDLVSLLQGGGFQLVFTREPMGTRGMLYAFRR